MIRFGLHMMKPNANLSLHIINPTEVTINTAAILIPPTHEGPPFSLSGLLTLLVDMFLPETPRKHSRDRPWGFYRSEPQSEHL
jgi:hypothetical protein